ncbi:MAG: 16S rRNA (guanine(527)-N(7))-methyltransferase RsmG [Firmicutes bacterium]|nr:16S rRNA (guanine(527)-N(7))-methyltransferase RsmG [Bacillota bacterium]
MKHIDKFETFFKYLSEQNEIHNLTRIVSREDVFEKHFKDSLSAMPFIADGMKVVDIGAGGGFPSIPLAIEMPSVEFLLVDSVGKKVEFLKQSISLLGLTNASAVHMRAEDLAIKQREQFDIGVARAVAPMPTLLEYLAPLVKVGGTIIAFKGSSYKEEIEQAKNAEKLLGLKLETIFKYNVGARPETSPLDSGCSQVQPLQSDPQTRVLVIYKKVEATNKKYPRIQNKPRTNPL